MPQNRQLKTNLQNRQLITKTERPIQSLSESIKYSNKSSKGRPRQNKVSTKGVSPVPKLKSTGKIYANTPSKEKSVFRVKGKTNFGKGYDNLNKLFSTNVVEIKFVRRNPKKGYSDERRMLCTSNWGLLSAKNISHIFTWKLPPKQGRGSSYYKSRNLMIVWDLMKLNFRVIPIDAMTVINAMPIMTTEEKSKFLSIFNVKFKKMSTLEKKRYFNS